MKPAAPGGVRPAFGVVIMVRGLWYRTLLHNDVSP